MNYAQYVQLMTQAAKLVEKGAYRRARGQFERLLASDISPLDKSVICVNLALVAEKQTRDAEVLSWFDQAIDYEKPYCRIFATEHKAAYLVKTRRHVQAKSIYTMLLGQPFLTEQDKERIRQNASTLSGV